MHDFKVVQSALPTICRKCSHGQVVEFANGDVVIRCRPLRMVLSQAVDRCTDFVSRTAVDINDMRNIARYLDLDELRKGKPGFKLAKDVDTGVKYSFGDD